jgi:hypothetical protein
VAIEARRGLHMHVGRPTVHTNVSHEQVIKAQKNKQLQTKIVINYVNNSAFKVYCRFTSSQGKVGN